MKVQMVVQGVRRTIVASLTRPACHAPLAMSAKLARSPSDSYFSTIAAQSASSSAVPLSPGSMPFDRAILAFAQCRSTASGRRERCWDIRRARRCALRESSIDIRADGPTCRNLPGQQLLSRTVDESGRADYGGGAELTDHMSTVRRPRSTARRSAPLAFAPFRQSLKGCIDS